MAYLGIDYGKKFVGLATSDESDTLAFPLNVLPNDGKLLGYIEAIVAQKNIQGLVLGDSVNQKGEKNIIAGDAEMFAQKLKDKIQLPVYFEKEGFTSAHAKEGLKANERADARAASLILQRFLDKKNRI